MNSVEYPLLKIYQVSIQPERRDYRKTGYRKKKIESLKTEMQIDKLESQKSLKELCLAPVQQRLEFDQIKL